MIVDMFKYKLGPCSGLRFGIPTSAGRYAIREFLSLSLSIHIYMYMCVCMYVMLCYVM